MNRREFLVGVGVGAAMLAAQRVGVYGQGPAAANGPRLNVLLLTADDMNFDTPDIVRGIAPDVTPNLDLLSKSALRFVYSHVTVAVCQPSRETLMTGRYPCRSGANGFVPVNADCPTLQESLHAAGYELGILGKVSHLKPYEKFPWDYQKDADDLHMGRDPESYYKSATEFFAKAKQDHKPFFLMANSHDPHRPFAGSKRDIKANTEPGTAKRSSGEPGDAVAPMPHPDPKRIYTADEVRVPGFLPDLPDIRTELAQYASSCHRCDETLGKVLQALKESGMEDNTVIFFLSDNGMSFPFAKANCYLTSTRTPLMVRWPGHTKPGSVDNEHLVASIDFMPTVLDILKIAPPPGMDGKSYVPLLNGQPQDGFDHVFTNYDRGANMKLFLNMRCVQDHHFGYIYNDWSGKVDYMADNMSDLTFAAMKEAGKTNSDIANRADFYVHRVPEELYDLEKDPDCLTNLAGDPAYAKTLVAYRTQLLGNLKATGDPFEAPLRKIAGG